MAVDEGQSERYVRVAALGAAPGGPCTATSRCACGVSASTCSAHRPAISTPRSARSRSGSRVPSEARREAGSLVRKRYASRGYLTSTTLVNSNVCTFSRVRRGRLAGTVSLRLDSTEGVAADELYRAEIDAIRGDGHRVCEFTRLAVDTSRRSQPVLAGAVPYGVPVRAAGPQLRLRGDRGEPAARRLLPAASLGFDVIGPERHNPRVDAPAVLMGISFAAHRPCTCIDTPARRGPAPQGAQSLRLRFLAGRGGRRARRLRALDADAAGWRRALPARAISRPTDASERHDARIDAGPAAAHLVADRARRRDAPGRRDRLAHGRGPAPSLHVRRHPSPLEAGRQRARPRSA